MGVQDPREAKRDEARGWMNENKDKLEQQVGPRAAVGLSAR